MRLKGSRVIRSPGQTRTTVWKPPLTNPWEIDLQKGKELGGGVRGAHPLQTIKSNTNPK